MSTATPHNDHDSGLTQAADVSNPLRRRALRALSLGYVRIVRAVTPTDHPAPLALFTWAQRILPLDDALAPRWGSTAGSASGLSDRWLAERLGDEIGTWSLDASTVNLLCRRTHAIRPRAILEFGSGVSTLCLAHWASELHGVGRRYVVSLEQDAAFARQTTAVLNEYGLEREATVIHAPLVPVVVAGRSVSCYRLETDRILDLLERPAELVFVDGPSAESGGSRFATVPTARGAIANGAVIFMDDARRDRELDVARLWHNVVPWLRVRGIHPVGKGLLEATVTSAT